ncbi:MAG: transposase, partial [Caedimonas sp.]|nr:transposase [Caedimonas sp.]
MNILEVYKRFPDQKACIKYLEKIRWGNKPICPYCNSKNT